MECSLQEDPEVIEEFNYNILETDLVESGKLSIELVYID